MANIDESAHSEIDYSQFPCYGHMVNVSSTDYYAHVQNYLNHYANAMTWLDYCLVFKPIEERQVDFFEMPRNFMWY